MLVNKDAYQRETKVTRSAALKGPCLQYLMLYISTEIVVKSGVCMYACMYVWKEQNMSSKL